MIIVDSREPQDIIKKLIKRGKDRGVEVKIERLAYGDYLVIGSNGKMVIERKTIDDLKNSINNGRIWKQLDGVRAYNGEYIKVLLLEGTPYWMIKNGLLNWNRWIAWKTTFLVKSNIMIYESAKKEETIQFLFKVDEYLNEEGKRDRVVKDYEIPTVIRKKVETDRGEMVGILVGFKGVGEKIAEKLLSKFGSLKNIFNAKEEELEDVVGKKVGSHMWKIINEIYDGEEEK